MPNNEGKTESLPPPNSQKAAAASSLAQYESAYSRLAAVDSWSVTSAFDNPSSTQTSRDTQPPPGTWGITSRQKNFMRFTSDAKHLKYERLFIFCLFQVDFEQFKNALILVLSSHIERQQSEEETLSKPGKAFSCKSGPVWC